ncbi:DNA polymerase III subunit gamma/tau [Candidatus Falkowbacteria bacterium]|nr:DNA polymerase III subunit gamma/tau [Candidatus Falkowbacteria bacterium]
MATLYQKYRPQNFSEVVGQNHIKLILQHELSANQLAHAYLFCGPRAVGKTTLARVLATAANCLNIKPGQFEPCGTCEACVEIVSGRSFDVVEIDAASHTGVDNVRESIIATARISPTKLKRKVFIIDEVHMLSTAAWNALLKTLEEPPESVVFVLCTTEVHKVPQTIISRCQRFDFKRISMAEVVRKLNHIASQENITVEKGILESIARHADGHMRDAESLLGQLVNMGGDKIDQADADLVIPRSDLSEVVNLIEMLGKKDTASGIQLINKLLNEGVDLRVFVGDLVEILRKLLMIKINPALSDWLGLEMGEALELRLNQANKALTQEQIVAYIEQFVRTANELKSSFILQLPFELAIVRLCTAAPAAVAQPSAPKTAVAASAQAEPVEQVQTHSLAPAVPAGEFDYELIIARWSEFLARVKNYNHSLSFILKVCQPKSLNGNELCLAFKYKFHKDRVSDPTIKALLERVLHETYATSLTIEAVVDEQLEVTVSTDPAQLEPKNESAIPNAAGPAVSPQGEQMVDNLLKAFGGKIVG